ncbi:MULTISPECIES: zinc-binding dehydrogenase [unclassified Microbacterium]|uniref:zinc-dependent alcohol dehydrogenase n=1 Tax=unclassified Microbacterium TaxID=2609290 RepID=UPI000EAA5A1D|nr:MULTISPECIES: alcohol dehydrogenase catalytic domain-containing protein [unclassified Microbacterium]MBT2486499.1 alcohol dehydrogenase catalytic domain-containing protein [Microbacterium sp. ISL-108]RKN69195.1 alcohol dehydrogenase [Microbacterium sp. CGR2]
MKVLVVTGPGRASIEDVASPVPSAGEVVVDVQRAGICGTDMELFSGEMQYLHDGNAAYPLRIGHEWMGTVASVASDVDPSWIGRRVTGDTMIGCGICERCRNGFHHVCAFRFELGVRGGMPGALAEQVAVPVTSLHTLPASVDDAAGAMVEPGGNAWRSVDAAQLRSGERALILGPGTIGLLCAMFARAAGAEVHLMGRAGRSLDFARSLEWDGVWTAEELPDKPWHAVIDASNAPDLPARALELVEPGRRVVHVGLAGSPSFVDTRTIALKDVTAVGILGASAGLDPTIAAFADGSVDPRPLVASTIFLEDLPQVLAGRRPSDSGPGPKIHIDTTAQ